MKGAIHLESFDFYAREVTPADLLEQGRSIFKAQCYSMTIVSVNMKRKLIEIMEKKLEQLGYHFIYFYMHC